MAEYRGLLDRYVELYNAGDLDGVMDLYAEDSSQLMPDGTLRVDRPSAIVSARSWTPSRISPIAS